jgi:hypothetical protein
MYELHLDLMSCMVSIMLNSQNTINYLLLGRLFQDILLLVTLIPPLVRRLASSAP